MGVTNSEVSESEICDRLYAVVKEGKAAFKSGAPTPYPPRTIFNLMHMLGWCLEDHRQALMKANPAYGAEQRRFEAAGLF